MRLFLKTALFAAAVSVAPLAAANAGPVEGAAIGAGTGAVIAGPVGAVVGGTVGAVVGGPNIIRPVRHRTCWTNHRGHRVCAWR